MNYARRLFLVLCFCAPLTHAQTPTLLQKQIPTSPLRTSKLKTLHANAGTVHASPSLAAPSFRRTRSPVAADPGLLPSTSLRMSVLFPA